MFDSLRKKIGGWFGAGKEKPEEGKKKVEEKIKEKVRKSAKVKIEKKAEKAVKKPEKKIKETKLEKKEDKKEIKVKDKREIFGEREIEEPLIIDKIIEEKIIEEEKEEKSSEKEIKEKGIEEGWLTKWWKKKEKIKLKNEEEKEDEAGKEELKEEFEEEKGEEIKDKGIKEEDEGRKEIEGEETIEEEKGREEEDKDKVEIEVKEEIEIEEENEDEKEDEAGKEELKKELEEESGFFARLKKKLLSNDLKKEEFEEIFLEFEIILLENNVALAVVDKIKENLGKSLIGASVKKKDVEDKIKESLKEAILSVLIDGENIIDKIKESKNAPYVILFFGINGTGKTTTIGKIAYKLKEEGISCVMAAGDTFRAASIEQLEKHAERVGVPIVKSEYNSDPASVGFEAISYAKKNKIKVVLIDTAGRMYTKSNLMKEMEKIVKVTKPNLKIFVGESITGNDATEQAKMFNETAGIDGIILTKADVDEKSGAILSVSHVTGKPIFYLGMGQEYKDLQIFKKEDVLKGLGME